MASPAILLVDDNLTLVQALADLLADEYDVEVARNGEAALVALRARPFDIVISDYEMPGISGVELLARAREERPECIRMLMTSHYHDTDALVAAINRGEVYRFLQKPIELVNLLTDIRRALEQRNLQRENERLRAERAAAERLAFVRRYFDPRVFEALNRDPQLLALRPQHVTICFWDIRGFSRLSEMLKAHPADLGAFLREFFDAAADAIFAHDGVLDNFLGDGVMALFGALGAAPEDDRQAALDAVRAAIALRDRFADLAATWHERWALHTPQKIDIGLGCGIHSGEPLVGNVGARVRDHFTALGPDVNLAARIVARSGSGQILLSQSTAARVRSQVIVTPAGEVSDIKNIAGTFELFAVDREESAIR